jgi:histidyl-tRNA synthetase
VFDCKVEDDRRLLEGAPDILDHLDDDSTAHFEEVRRLLDRFDIPYRVDSRLVRGLDYYERTVFEVVTDRLGAQNAILGGGRYDGLVRDLGGPEVAGFGFAVGIERLLSLLDEDRVPHRPIDVALVALGPEGWDACIDLSRRLRGAGVRAVMPLTQRPMGAQVKRADRLGARFALFVGAAELESGKFGLKDLATGRQTETDEAGLLARLGVNP